MLLELSQFFPLFPPPPSPSPAPTVNPHTVVHVHGSFIHALWLVPSSSFHLYPPPLLSGCCRSVPCSHASGSLLLVSWFCSLDSSYRWHHTALVILSWKGTHLGVRISFFFYLLTKLAWCVSWGKNDHCQWGKCYSCTSENWRDGLGEGCKCFALDLSQMNL